MKLSFKNARIRRYLFSLPGSRRRFSGRGFPALRFEVVSILPICQERLCVLTGRWEPALIFPAHHTCLQTVFQRCNKNFSVLRRNPFRHSFLSSTARSAEYSPIHRKKAGQLRQIIWCLMTVPSSRKYCRKIIQNIKFSKKLSSIRAILRLKLTNRETV